MVSKDLVGEDGDVSSGKGLVNIQEISWWGCSGWVADEISFCKPENRVMNRYCKMLFLLVISNFFMCLLIPQGIPKFFVYKCVKGEVC